MHPLVTPSTLHRVSHNNLTYPRQLPCAPASSPPCQATPAPAHTPRHPDPAAPWAPSPSPARVSVAYLNIFYKTSLIFFTSGQYGPDNYFQYINVPAHKTFEWGYKRGNPKHNREEYLSQKDHTFKAKVDIKQHNHCHKQMLTIRIPNFDL